MRKLILIIAIAIIVLITQNARATMIEMTTPVEFDNYTQIFAGIQSDGVSFEGDGFYQNTNSDPNRTMLIDVLADGIWTNIWTSTPSTVPPP